MTRIVVGVDGSSTSRRAMQRAVEEAQLRDGTVDAVFSYEPPRIGLSDDIVGLARSVAAPIRKAGADGRGQEKSSGEQAAQQEAERRLGQFVKDALSGVDGPEPKLLAVASEHPATALIDESETADLLVVGTRGVGGLKGMLLGSVAHQCIQQSQCPVLVMPAEAD